MTGEKIKLTASGRTDAGVHALAQPANFKTESSIPLKGFVHGLNSLIPDDICVKRADLMPESFDSRRSALRKTYLYRILNAPVNSALQRRFCWHVSKELDAEAMAEAGRELVGVHDFEAFRSVGCEAEHAVREIYSLVVRREGDFVEIEVTGSGFLRHMVRVITGTLAEAGQGRLTALGLRGIITAKERVRAGMTAPAQGLFLKEVFYDMEPLELYP